MILPKFPLLKVGLGLLKFTSLKFDRAWSKAKLFELVNPTFLALVGSSERMSIDFEKV